MSEIKHTPGPWRYESGSVWHKEYHRIGSPDRNNRHICPTERDANARLMAASPDLLEACELMLTFESLIREHRPSAVYTLERARAAIAKAKGEG